MFELITGEELIKRLKDYNHKELHMHHTWQPNHSNFKGNNWISLQNSMRDYHVSKGWKDIGQHVTLLPNGLFVTGRNFANDPASIQGYNEGAFAVEMLGDFDIGKDKFEGEQKESMIKLAKYFYDKGKYIRFHRENADKTCPGTAIIKDKFMEEVKNYIGGIDLNKIVTYYGDADVFAAVIVSQKLGCPMMKFSDYKESGLKVREEIQIGGLNATIGGKDRFETFKNAGKLV